MARQFKNNIWASKPGNRAAVGAVATSMPIFIRRWTMELCTEDKWTDAYSKIAMARIFADMLSHNDLIDDQGLRDAIQGHYVVLTELYEFIAAINTGTLNLQPITWENCKPIPHKEVTQ